MNGSRIIVALDFPDAEPARALSRKLDPKLCRVKVGKQLFGAAGPALVRELTDAGFDVFLDLKYHDIPNTVAGACRAAVAAGAWMINVHALGGRAMLDAARAAIDGAPRRALLLAVTVLTSMNDTDLDDVGIPGSVNDTVLRLATLAQSCGLDGVVCSAREAPLLRRHCGPDFVLVTPGIRLAQDAAGDQKRVVTPGAAVAAGADYLVIGRSITQAVDPLAALHRIADEVEAAGR
ncbi:MAG TPA: orotidine-5'-phosphate decarboxylase [Burkholderiales bacterium]|nr:orotidine-5'-phosphate decarboxylase [Burkholderiales bacterium]